MRIGCRLLVGLVTLTLLAGLATAQQAISARSGMIHYVQGRALLDGKAVEPKFGTFPQMNESSLLRTEQGRAEVLLTPGVFLRLGESSTVRMISNRLSDTRLELLEGSALIECAELLRGNAIMLVFKDAKIWLRQDGLYRLSAEPAELRVYDGEAGVEQSGQPLTVKKGRVLALDGTLALAKFDTKTGDTLFRWARQRSEYLAMANVSSARSVWQGRQSWLSSGWMWNPYFGMFTYLPYRGVYRSFWGYQYWSPRQVYIVFQPPMTGGGGYNASGSRSYNPSLGYNTVGSTSAGTSGTVASTGASTAASSSSTASVPRESSQGGGRGR